MSTGDDLDQQLRAYLERNAPTPPEPLLDELLRTTATTSQRTSRFAFGAAAQWGLGAAAVAVLVAVALLVRGTQQPSTGGPSTGPTSSATGSAQPSETTITLPIPVREKAIALQAIDVFEARLRALGVGDFTSSAGDDITFSLMIPDGVDPADVDLVLHSIGDVSLLAWTNDLPAPAEGAEVPDGVLPVFDMHDQVTSVTLLAAEPGSNHPAVQISLGPVGAEALAAYTSAHVSRPMPLAMDGRILMAPTIQGAINGGDLVIAFADESPISAPALEAILESGPLPTGWTVDPTP